MLESKKVVFGILLLSEAFDGVSIKFCNELLLSFLSLQLAVFGWLWGHRSWVSEIWPLLAMPSLLISLFTWRVLQLSCLRRLFILVPLLAHWQDSWAFLVLHERPGGKVLFLCFPRMHRYRWRSIYHIDRVVARHLPQELAWIQEIRQRRGIRLLVLVWLLCPWMFLVQDRVSSGVLVLKIFTISTISQMFSQILSKLLAIPFLLLLLVLLLVGYGLFVQLGILIIGSRHLRSFHM